MSEQILEPKTLSPEEQAGHEAQINLDFFWQEIADHETLSQLGHWGKRWIMDTTLWLQLEPTPLNADQVTIEKLGLNQFTTWQPKTRRETYAATHAAGPRKSLRTIKAFWKDALNDDRISAQGITANQAGSKTDLTLIRGNEQLLYMLADHFMARESFVSG